MHRHKVATQDYFIKMLMVERKKIDAPHLATLFTKLYNSEGANLLLNL